MQLTPEQKQMGKDNFNEAVGFGRREFLTGAAAAGTGLGAFYFGYDKLKGERVRVGFIGTGDEGSVLLTQHPPEYMEIVAIADIRPTNLRRALDGDGNEDRVGLIKKLVGHTDEIKAVAKSELRSSRGGSNVTATANDQNPSLSFAVRTT